MTGRDAPDVGIDDDADDAAEPGAPGDEPASDGDGDDGDGAVGFVDEPDTERGAEDERRVRSERRSLARLRDLTGGLPRPFHPDEGDLALLGDDGHLDRDEQLRILALLFPPTNRASAVRFFFMLGLSVTIAVMGLALNSPAVVIGAMLIAPLMTPIITFAAAVGLGLGRRAIQAAFLAGAGAIGSIIFAYVLASLLPTVEIGSEVLSRTAPDVRDLVVAIAAGAAGAYATAREDVSSALPGVAVAVALVPPLAATGILLEADRRVLAEGSALLFLTNLLAIIVSALAVLLATGVVPTIKLAFQSPRIAATTVAIVVATVAVAVPLTQRSLEAADSSRIDEEIAETVEAWIGTLRLEAASPIEQDGSRIVVELSGPDEPPPANELANALVPILGPDAEATVRWDQRAQGSGRAGVDPPPDPDGVARAAIERWVNALAERGISLDVLDVGVETGETATLVDVSVSGPVPPPGTVGLSDELATALGGEIEVDLRWIQSFAPDGNGEPAEARLERATAAWIGSRVSVRLIDVSVDGDGIVIDLAADGTPLGLDALRQLALDTVEGPTTVDVRLLPLELAPIVPDDFGVPPID